MAPKPFPSFHQLLLRKRKADTMLGIAGLILLLLLSVLLLLLQS